MWVIELLSQVGFESLFGSQIWICGAKRVSKADWIILNVDALNHLKWMKCTQTTELVFHNAMHWTWPSISNEMNEPEVTRRLIIWSACQKLRHKWHLNNRITMFLRYLDTTCWIKHNEFMRQCSMLLFERVAYCFMCNSHRVWHAYCAVSRMLGLYSEPLCVQVQISPPPNVKVLVSSPQICEELSAPSSAAWDVNPRETLNESVFAARCHGVQVSSCFPYLYVECVLCRPAASPAWSQSLSSG